MIIIPYNIDFTSWAENLYIDLPDLNIPLPPSEDQWQLWADRLIEENKLTSAPLPKYYNNWKIWAEYFIETM